MSEITFDTESGYDQTQAPSGAAVVESEQDEPATEDDRPSTGTAAEEPETNAGRGKGGRSMSRAQIRRVAAKAQEVAEADDVTRRAAANLVGSGPGISELTTAIMAADRGSAQAISDLTQIAEMDDPMEAGVHATALERPRLRAVWSLLAALGAGPVGNIPNADVKAALTVAKSAQNLDDEVTAQLESVVELMKKH